jgi:Ras GTPase-activating-like protein IQGAP2/3
MDRSNSISSVSSTASSGSTKTTSSSHPFAYQTRLLERTSSRVGSGSLSRSNSLSGGNILNSPTSPTVPSSTRKWTPSHRVGNSLDAVRGKWEERAKAEALLENQPSTTPSDTVRHTQRRPTSIYGATLPTFPSHDKRSQAPLSPISVGTYTPSVSPIKPSYPDSDINASSPLTSPPSATFSMASGRTFSRSTHPSQPPSPEMSSQSPFSPVYPNSATTSSSSKTFGRPHSFSSPPLPNKYGHSPISPISPSSASVSASSAGTFGKPLPSLPPSSVMAPSPYKSSYMASKKASTYGDNLVVGRKLGRHLPRIASGDEDQFSEQEKAVDEKQSRRERRERRTRGWEKDPLPDRPKGQARHISGAISPDDVVGVPGRLRLSKDITPAAISSPLPSARLARGLWADVQRQHLQAYEYLCHVGEAQEWIELCLNQELGFGVVEMEESLRNGVVLAKLAQVFQGGDVVRRIYEVRIARAWFQGGQRNHRYFPRLQNWISVTQTTSTTSSTLYDLLDSQRYVYPTAFYPQSFRHNCLQGFIFELTDLYEKKNFPKVIYCIHALRFVLDFNPLHTIISSRPFSHLLARRGMAQRIGNLLGCLKFTEEQLRQTQKGLKDAGVAMPNFGNVGKELAKEINEEEIETEDERKLLCFTDWIFVVHTSQAETACFSRMKHPSWRCSAWLEVSSSAKRKPLSESVYVLRSDMLSRFKPMAEVCWHADAYTISANAKHISLPGSLLYRRGQEPSSLDANGLHVFGGSNSRHLTSSRYMLRFAVSSSAVVIPYFKL